MVIIPCQQHYSSPWQPGLDSAPGRLDEGGLAAVLPHDAHPELASHALAPGLVPGEDRPGQPVLRGVRNPHRLFLAQELLLVGWLVRR